MLSDLPVQVLTIIPKDKVSTRLSRVAPKKGFLLSHEPDFHRACASLNSEGYRYRLIVAKYSILEDARAWLTDMTKKLPWAVFALYDVRGDMEKMESSLTDPAGAFNHLLVDFKEHAVGKVLDDPSKPEFVVEGLVALLTEAKSKISELPLPPKQDEDIHFLCEAGPLSFSISHTARPWDLEGDAFMLPVDENGNFGPIGRAWKKELGINGSKLQKLVKDAVPKSDLGFREPIHVELPQMDGAQLRSQKLILAPSGGNLPATLMNPIEASLSAIDLASRMKGCRTLIMPVSGDGAVGLPSDRIIRGILDDFDSKALGGELKHVIFTVFDREPMDRLSEIQETVTARGPNLVKDLAPETDHLQVECDTKALADALALKDMQPPLVLGILGSSGKGKSFALHLLMNRFRQLRCWDLHHDDVRATFPYIGHPYLVHFDAWTYAKADPWASLMEQIFLHLNRQLSLEKILEESKSGLLCQGVDIWLLQENSTSQQVEDLQTKLNRKGLEALNRWKKEENGAELLWDVLRAHRVEEHRELDKARNSLSEEETKHDLEVAEKQRQFEEEVRRQRQIIELSLAKKSKDLQLEIDNAQITLETTKRKAVTETDKEIQIAARNEAWVPVFAELKKILGSAADRALKTIGVKEDEAPLSISRVGRELPFFTKFLSGLMILNAGRGFLALSILSPILAWLVSLFNVADFWPTLTLTGGILGGLLGSGYTSLSEINRWIKEQDHDYRTRIEEAKKRNEPRREKLLQEKLSAVAKPLEIRIQQLMARNKTETENFEAEIRSTGDGLLANRLMELEEFKKKGQAALQVLKAKVELHQRRAGITGRQKTLFDYVEELREGDDDDHQLGFQQKIQEDIKEVTEAFIPGTGFNWETFPRGQPRIILMVENLDRCPPAQVVNMLKAIHLLAKTKLFVVVLAMDIQYISRALEKEYEGVLVQDGHPSGLDFIEKIVQIFYSIPSIAPGEMRSFLQGHMEVVKEAPDPIPGDVAEEGDAPTTMAVHTKARDSVSESSLGSWTGRPQEPLPARVQQNDEKELRLLTESSNLANVTPRAACRLVDVYKIFKIIWYHRGPHMEPTHEIKRVIMLMLALSSSEPAIMQRVLDFLERECRDGEVTQRLTASLLTFLQQRPSVAVHPKTNIFIKNLVDKLNRWESAVTLEMLGLDNVRLLKSFSFVGEEKSSERVGDNFEDIQITDLSHSPNAPQ